jgi:glycolate oxidase iron-sulfur subunit
VIPEGQGCCGALSMHAGREEEGLDFARRLVETFCDLDVDAVVVNAAGCGSNLKDYGRLLAKDPSFAEAAARVSSRVRDVSELLAGLPSVAPRGPISTDGKPVRVAYHDACHLANAQGIRSAPRDLLRAIPDVELVEIPDGDRESCCGSAGIYNLVEPESADEIGARKADQVASARADLLASANPGCTLQIQKFLRERGLALRAMHPIEIVQASIAAATRGPS